MYLFISFLVSLYIKILFLNKSALDSDNLLYKQKLAIKSPFLSIYIIIKLNVFSFFISILYGITTYLYSTRSSEIINLLITFPSNEKINKLSFINIQILSSKH